MAIKCVTPYQGAITSQATCAPLLYEEYHVVNSTFQVTQKSLGFVVGEQLVRPFLDQSYSLIHSSLSWLDRKIASFSPFLGAQAAETCTARDFDTRKHDAKKSYLNGDYEASVEKFTAMLGCKEAWGTKKLAEILNHRGIAYRALGKIRESILDHLEAFKLEKNEGLVQFNPPMGENSGLLSPIVSGDNERLSLDEFILDKLVSASPEPLVKEFGHKAELYLYDLFQGLFPFESWQWGDNFKEDLTNLMKQLQKELPEQEKGGVAEYFFRYCQIKERSTVRINEYDLNDLRKGWLSFHGLNAQEAKGLATLLPIITYAKEVKQLLIQSVSVEGSYRRIEDEGVIAIANALPKSIRSIWLTDQGITVVGLKVLTDALNDNVRELSLRGNPIGNDGAIYLMDRIPPEIERLFLDETELDDAGFVSVAKNLPSSIKELGIRKNKMGKIGAQAFAEAISNLPNLKQNDLLRDLRSNLHGKECLEVLKILLPHLNITNLDLDGGGFGNELFNYASIFPRRIKSLSLHNNDIKIHGPQALEKALQFFRGISWIESLNMQQGNCVASQYNIDKIKEVFDNKGKKAIFPAPKRCS